MHCNMPECSYGLNSSVCLPNSLIPPYKSGIVYDLITDQMRRWEAGTYAEGLDCPNMLE